MKVLIACEESQRVCTEFRELGHEAYSCDILKCSGGHPEWHINQDVIPIINGDCNFTTMDGIEHKIEGEWDLIIAHPPCTRLCTTGNRWYHDNPPEKIAQLEKERDDAIEFFMAFINAKCEHIAVENPVGIMSTRYRKPDCYYNPYDFIGETDSKRTCLWLKNLPILKKTQDLPLEKRTTNAWKGQTENGTQVKWGTLTCARIRSKTPIGVAKAMASQWSSYLENN